MKANLLTAREIAQFQEDGYVLVHRLLDPEELALLQKVAEHDTKSSQSTRKRKDASGTTTKLDVHNELGEDLYGAIVRAEPMVNAMEELLGGEVYHYHHKIMIKEAHVGGAWEWHQDYGYWYGNGCLFPWMLSCLIAINHATQENGCLKVLQGSHHLGRLDHVKLGDQTAADPERVAVARQRLKLRACELEPGSAVIFHCNLLHCSEANRSDEPRLSLITCYNAKRNDPYKVHHHPNYRPLEKWPVARIKSMGHQHLSTLREGTEDEA